MSDFYQKTAKEIQKIASEKKLKSICDYGCGKGNLLNLIQKENPDFSLYGIDYFEKYQIEIEIEEGGAIHFIDRSKDDYKKLLKNQKFDIIISTFALHHFEYPIQELKSIYDLLNPNGLFILYDLSFLNNSKAKMIKNITSYFEEMGAAFKNHFHRHHYTLEQALDLIFSTPLKIIEADNFEDEISEQEQKEDCEHKLKRNAMIQKNIKEKAPDYWKKIWLPIFQHEEKLVQEFGLDYASYFRIIGQK